MVVIFAASSRDKLQKEIADFFDKRRLTVINVSHSSCLDPGNNVIIFSVAIAYVESTGE